MITRKKFKKKYNGKCDCCKRVTMIQGKIEISDPADPEMLAGELQLCYTCYPLLLTYLTNEPARDVTIENDVNNNDIFDETLQLEEFDRSSLPADAIELI